MAAGLGFKTFNTGDVLSAADVNSYLMQGVLVFADATARDAAITSPQEGQFAFLKDTNVTTYYTGSAWANLDTTGMTNPMTTTGDVIYSSSGSTPARLGIGTANQQLRVNSGATAPEWFTPAASASGSTLITTNNFSASSGLNFNNVFTSTYKNYQLIISFTSSGNASVNLRFRNSGSDISSSTYYWYAARGTSSGADAFTVNPGTQILDWANNGADAYYWASLNLTDVFETRPKYVYGSFAARASSASYGSLHLVASQQSSITTIDGFSVIPSTGTITGSVSLYGLAQ